MADVTPKETNREGVRTLIRRGAQLVEVLPRDEYDQIHLAGAVSIPLSHFDRTLANRLQWDKPVVVYGRDNQDDLSARAAWRLASMGFTQVYRYTAGKADWLANGLPAEGKAARSSGAGDLADLDVPTCKRNEKIQDIRERVRKAGRDVCVVVNDQEVVLGLLREIAFEKANPHWSAEEAMEHAPKTFRLDAPLAEIMDYFQAKQGIDSVLVTTSDGLLFGLVRREDASKHSPEA